MMEKLAEVTFDGDQTSVTFENIPDEYEYLLLYFEGQNNGTDEYVGIRPNFNDDTSDSNYETYFMSFDSSLNSGVRSFGRINFMYSPDRDNHGWLSTIEGYSNPSMKTTYSSTISNPHAAQGEKNNGWWDNDDVVTKMELISESDADFAEGSYFALYGVKA